MLISFAVSDEICVVFSVSIGVFDVYPSGTIFAVILSPCDLATTSAIFNQLNHQSLLMFFEAILNAWTKWFIWNKCMQNV